MRQLTTQGIILSRTDFGEADRIITMLTPDSGKLRLVAKGVRKLRSKLAGGIELFSVSHITYIKGRGELDTLVSTRLEAHYEHIVKDLDRTMFGYDLIKMLNRATEDEPEADYFHLLQQAFQALDDTTIGLELIKLWFAMQLLRLGGHAPNLQTDQAGDKLAADRRYEFSFEDMALQLAANGRFGVNEIKFLRLGFAGHHPKVLAQVRGSAMLVDEVAPCVQAMIQTYIRQ